MMCPMRLQARKIRFRALRARIKTAISGLRLLLKKKLFFQIYNNLRQLSWKIAAKITSSAKNPVIIKMNPFLDSTYASTKNKSTTASLNVITLLKATLEIEIK